MRVKNKEIRARRHRKEQKIKEAMRAIREQYGDKKTDTKAAAKPAAKKTASKAPKKAAAKTEA